MTMPTFEPVAWSGLSSCGRRIASPTRIYQWLEPNYSAEQLIAAFKAGKAAHVEQEPDFNDGFNVADDYFKPLIRSGSNSTEPSEDAILKGMMALLECSMSDLSDYSPDLYDGYRNDVIRVIKSMNAAPPAPAVPDVWKQFAHALNYLIGTWQDGKGMHPQESDRYDESIEAARLMLQSAKFNEGRYFPLLAASPEPTK